VEQAEGIEPYWYLHIYTGLMALLDRIQSSITIITISTCEDDSEYDYTLDMRIEHCYDTLEGVDYYSDADIEKDAYNEVRQDEEEQDEEETNGEEEDEDEDNGTEHQRVGQRGVINTSGSNVNIITHHSGNHSSRHRQKRWSIPFGDNVRGMPHGQLH
jgi:hypothetical protein